MLGERPNQVDRRRDEVSVEAGDLLDVRVPGGEVTEDGIRNNVSVGLQYLESWLRGVGAVAIYNLMEDAATAEISRSQIWQWVRHGALDDRQVHAATRKPSSNGFVTAAAGTTRARSSSGRPRRGLRRVPDPPGLRTDLD